MPKPRTLWLMTMALVLIGVAVVTRRMIAMYGTPRADGVGVDAGFAQHRALTTLHIVPGLVFLLLGPLQFMRRLRARYPRFHRWTGRVFLVASVVVGVTALIMGPKMAIGGAREIAATTVFGCLFLFSLAKAFLAIRHGQVALHREWMIRGFAIGLAVTTIRPIIGFFFATSRLTGLTPHDFFGTAFWIGFTLQTAFAELWIRAGKGYPRAAVQRS